MYTEGQDESHEEGQEISTSHNYRQAIRDDSNRFLRGSISGQLVFAPGNYDVAQESDKLLFSCSRSANE
jgi:hypothetical protein